MTTARTALLATCVAVTLLAVLFIALTWEDENKLATSVAALAGVASLGVAVWAVLKRPQTARLTIRNSGTAHGSGGVATSGISGRVGRHPGDILVEDSGEAIAKQDGEANTGVRIDGDCDGDPS